jgi:hypothetical protein
MKLPKTWQSAKMAVFSVVLLPALFISIAACGTDQEPGLLSRAATPDQIINSPVYQASNSAVEESLEINVKEFGAKGDGITDEIGRASCRERVY